MFCMNCGTSNKDSAKFCINCAQSLSEVQVIQKLSRPRARKMDSLPALLDLSFSRFISPKMTKFLYLLSILMAGLTAVFFIIDGFKASLWFGIFALLIGGPLTFLLIVVSSRVFLETILMIFQIADHTANIGAPAVGFPIAEERPESRDNIQWNI